MKIVQIDKNKESEHQCEQLSILEADYYMSLGISMHVTLDFFLKKNYSKAIFIFIMEQYVYSCDTIINRESHINS